MITTYAVVQDVRPNEAVAVLSETLTEAGVTGFEVALLSVAASGYTLSITAEVTRPNFRTLRRLCGALNLRIEETPAGEEEDPARGALRRKLQARPLFDPRGKEGRFAREHRPGGGE